MLHTLLILQALLSAPQPTTTAEYKAKPRLGEVTIRPFIAPQAFDSFLLLKLTAIEYCHSSYIRLAAPREDRIVIGFVLGPDGRVSSSAKILLKSTLNDPDFLDCTKRLIARWTFPAAKQSQDVTATVYLDPVTKGTEPRKGQWLMAPDGEAVWVPEEGNEGRPRSRVRLHPLGAEASPLASEGFDGLKGNVPRINYCYEKRLMNSPLTQGKLVISLFFDTDGRVSRVSFENGSIEDTELLACIEKGLSSLRIEHGPGAERYVLYLNPAQE